MCSGGMDQWQKTPALISPAAHIPMFVHIHGSCGNTEAHHTLTASLRSPGLRSCRRTSSRSPGLTPSTGRTSSRSPGLPPSTGRAARLSQSSMSWRHFGFVRPSRIARSVLGPSRTSQKNAASIWWNSRQKWPVKVGTQGTQHKTRHKWALALGSRSSPSRQTCHRRG
jgi:hypothetical protein